MARDVPFSMIEPLCYYHSNLLNSSKSKTSSPLRKAWSRQSQFLVAPARMWSKISGGTSIKIISRDVYRDGRLVKMIVPLQW